MSKSTSERQETPSESIMPLGAALTHVKACSVPCSEMRDLCAADGLCGCPVLTASPPGPSESARPSVAVTLHFEGTVLIDLKLKLSKMTKLPFFPSTIHVISSSVEFLSTFTSLHQYLEKIWHITMHYYQKLDGKGPACSSRNN